MRLLASVLTFVLATAPLAVRAGDANPRDVCPAAVRDILATEANADEPVSGTARAFGIVLRAYAPRAKARYRVVLGNDEHLFPTEVVVAIDRPPTPGGFWYTSAPTYVAFGSPRRIRDAWVEAVITPAGEETCGVNNVFTDRWSFAKKRYPFAGDDATGRAIEDGFADARPTSIPDDAERDRPSPACEQPEVFSAWVPGPPKFDKRNVVGPLHGRAVVRVMLAADSHIVDVQLLRSNVGASTEAEIVRSVRASAIRTSIFRCEPVPTDFVFNLGWT